MFRIRPFELHWEALYLTIIPQARMGSESITHEANYEAIDSR